MRCLGMIGGAVSHTSHPTNQPTNQPAHETYKTSHLIPAFSPWRLSYLYLQVPPPYITPTNQSFAHSHPSSLIHLHSTNQPTHTNHRIASQLHQRKHSSSTLLFLHHGVKKRLYLSPPDPDIVTRQTHVTRYIPESPSPSPPAVEYITLPPRPPPAIIQLPPPPPPTLPPAPMPPPFPAPVYSLPPLRRPSPPPLRRPSPEPEFIEVIAVSEDEKDDKKKKKKKKNKDKHHHRSKSRSSISSHSRSRSRSHHRHRDDDELSSRYNDRDSHRDVEESRDREVYIERERYIPYPVPMEPQYKTYRYVDAPRSPARRRASPSPPRFVEEDRERDYIRIKDREYRYD
ncbi:hypothetical protein GGI42DRAFT_188420 [Trichoderma sp. SZMC 28013]